MNEFYCAEIPQMSYFFFLIKLLFKAMSLKVETAVSRGLDIQHGFGTLGEELV